VTESPLKHDGRHQLVVVYQGKMVEILEVTVCGRQVAIDGPHWKGEGIVDINGGYIGVAYLLGLPFQPAFHRMLWDNGSFHGKMFYSQGTAEDAFDWWPKGKLQ